MTDKKSQQMTPAALRINSYAQRFQAAKYLEIGVYNKGATFLNVEMPLKVAVDPAFRFNPDEYAQTGALYLSITSDEFFATFHEHPQRSLYMVPDGRLAFDIININGIHAFEQSLRDFENSLKFSHQNTIWILDDTVPCDVFSTIPRDHKRLTLESRTLAGIHNTGARHGVVFRTLFAIHDFYPNFSYCTVMDRGNPQTVLWQASPLPERKPRFASRQEISMQGYLAVLEHADLFLPVNDNLASVLIGKSLAPALYAQPDTWKKMLYRKIVTTKEIKLLEQVSALKAAIPGLGFLSRKQKLMVRLITPVVKKLTSPANFQKFKKNPAKFFHSLKSPKYRIFGKIFFPLPKEIIGLF